MKKQKEIVTWIVESLEEYKKLEEKTMKRIESKKIEYSYHNERPVAQFITNYIDNKLGDDAFAFHELPIKGLSEEEIKDVKKKFSTKLKLSDKSIEVKFKRYYVDGYIGFSKPNQNENDGFFIEYKVNKKFNYLNFAIDILKFLIYTSRTEQRNTLLYIELRKDNPSFSKISSTPYQTDIKNIETDKLDKHNIFIIDVNSLKIDDPEIQKQLILIDELKEFYDNLSDDSTLDKKKFDKFNNSVELEKITIYGKKVFFSKKILKNAEKIISLYKAAKKKMKAVDGALIEEDYNRISEAMKALRDSTIAKKNKSSDSHNVSNKMSNWLLSFLKSTAKKMMIQEPEFITGDVYHDGSYHDVPNNNFEEMVAVSDGVIKKEEFNEERLFKILKHLNNVFNMVLEEGTISSTGELPKLNKEYNKYRKISSSSDRLKMIKKELTGTKRDSYVPGYNIEDDIQEWAKEIIANFSNENKK